MKERIFKNSITSLIGVVLIGLGVVILTLTSIDQATKLTISTLLFGAGLTGLGLKDPQKQD